MTYSVSKAAVSDRSKNDNNQRTKAPETTFCSRASLLLNHHQLGDKVTKATVGTVARRDKLVSETPEWQLLRHEARRIRLHALAHHHELMARLREQLERRGVHLQVASSASQACEIITKKVLQVGSKVIKSKSMTSEEVGLNHALEQAGVQVTETDLGELIVQLAGQAPSHVTAPAIHLSVEDIARIFRDKLAMTVPDWVNLSADHSNENIVLKKRDPSERVALAQKLSLFARKHLRNRFLQADVGITGANFLVADTGTIALISNEGNIALTSCLPKRHIVLAGIDKLIESSQHLGVMLRLLAPSATAQRQTSYVSLFTDAHADMHVVLLDRGRSRVMNDEQMHDVLTCIRCGACMNVCPVYRAVSGHAYGGAYPGPIGALLMPLLDDGQRYLDLPFASSLCAACSEACPVRIPLAERLAQMRSRVQQGFKDGGWDRKVQRDSLRSVLCGAMVPMCYPSAMRMLPELYSVAKQFAPFHAVGRAWLTGRQLPQEPEQSFRDWYSRQCLADDRLLGEQTAVRGQENKQPKLFESADSAGLLPNPTTAAVNHPSAKSADEVLCDRFSGLSKREAASDKTELLRIFVERCRELGSEQHVRLLTYTTAREAEHFLRTSMGKYAASRVYIQGESARKQSYDLAISLATLWISHSGGAVLDLASRVEAWGLMLSSTHIVVGKTDQIVATVSQALQSQTLRQPAARNCNKAKAGSSGYRLIMSGPSRTADVEKVVVIPAHGPRKVVIVLCDEHVSLSGLRQTGEIS